MSPSTDEYGNEKLQSEEIANWYETILQLEQDIENLQQTVEQLLDMAKWQETIIESSQQRIKYLEEVATRHNGHILKLAQRLKN